MIAPRNRVLELVGSTTLNGIDYVEVRGSDPTRLYVHFFNSVSIHTLNLRATVRGGDRIPEVRVEPVQPSDLLADPQGRKILRLKIPGRGDFSSYTLALQGGKNLDDYFRHVRFSFFAFCPSQVDCLLPDEECLPKGVLPPIDYLAKDFDSFRKALSDFSAQSFPEWRERAESDLGVVLMEALSAIGDDLSYIQDRVARECAIDTATERRSIVRLARLVDYEPRPLTTARTLLQCRVSATQLPAGILVSGQAPDGSPVPFETGTGLRDRTIYAVNPKWNDPIDPYWPDDRDRCLEPGATSMLVAGHGYGFAAGTRLLLDTQAESSADPPVREVVLLSQAGMEEKDPVYNQLATRIEWGEDALTRHHDLTRTRVLGNLVPATQGRRIIETFAIAKAPAPAPTASVALARLGPNSTAEKQSWQYRQTLGEAPLSYLEGPGEQGIQPEIALSLQKSIPREWTWTSSLLQATPLEERFAIEPGSWRRVLATPTGPAFDYDGSDGSTLCFGDGTFGELPNDGDLFEVKYRVSRGSEGNVPADTICSIDPAWLGILLGATNPLPSEGGADAETDEQIRRRAPHAFLNTVYRAVRPEDYDTQALRLSWIQQAGTVFRWTGSWPTIFTTADPRSAGSISRSQHVEFVQLLNRVRMAGYETYAPRPVYVSLDFVIRVCAKADAFQGDVYADVRKALAPVRHPDGTVGFFHFDSFTLGTPFERSRLESAIQAVSSVAGVLSIKYRRRGHVASFAELPSTVKFGPGEIFRLDNDLNRPERGSFRLKVEGGK